MGVTIRQIAEAAGVSRGTVDRALNNRGRIRPEVAERVRQIAEEMGYKPNQLGRALSMSRNNIKIGVILQGAETPFMKEVMKGVEEARAEVDNLAGSGRASMGKYKGMAPGSRIAALKVLDRFGKGNKEDVLQAFRWILQNRERYRFRIVNISVGTTYRTRNDQDVLVQGGERLWDEGLVVVAAAGNQGPKPGSVTAPGCSKKIITVGSSDMLSGKQAVSGRGPTCECVCKPDLVAPGRQIMACTPGAGNLYSMKSGTSMSTPLVSGAIALALEKDPLLSNVEIKMMLRDSCDDMGLPRNQQGWGKFNCKKFLAL